MRMDIPQCRQRFRDARVARLATVGVNGAAHLVPVTFAVIPALPGMGDAAAGEGGSGGAELVVFAVDHKPKSTTALRRLDNITANPRVAFLVDHYDDDWDQLWWVRADAVAAILDGADRLRAIGVLRGKYPQYEHIPPVGVVIGATVSRWSGWRSAEDDDQGR